MKAGWVRRVQAFLGLERNIVVLLGAFLLLGLGEELWVSFVPKYLEALGAGAVFSRAELQAILDGGEGPAAESGRDLFGHGTHIAGIAAGDDPLYTGVATGIPCGPQDVQTKAWQKLHRSSQSEGPCFFHNVTTFGVFLLTVSFRKPGEKVDWEWLESRSPLWEGAYLRHIRLEEPIPVYLDGHTGSGLILKSE